MLTNPVEADYRVTDVRKLTPSVAEIIAEPVDAPMPYEAGQYVLVCDAAGTLPARSFSFASAPDSSGLITLLVTRYPSGRFSGWVHDEMCPGDEVLLEGPYGALRPVRGPLLGICAGSGLAPIRAIVQEALANDPGADVVVVMSARTESHVVDGDRLTELARTHPQFRFIRTLTRAAGPEPIGRLPDQLAELVPDLATRQVVIAGPDSFVTACARAARSAGVPPSKLATEEYYADPIPWTAGPEPTAPVQTEKGVR